MSNFTNRLKTLIAQSNKNQNQICNDLGISKQKLSKWKTAYNEPNLDDITMLSNYFGVSTDYLLGVSDEIGNPGEFTKKTAVHAIMNRFEKLSTDQQELVLKLAESLTDKK